MGSVQHVFHHVVIKIQQLFLRSAACLTTIRLEIEVGANDWKCSRDQQLSLTNLHWVVYGRSPYV
jgi:hypothetical protein